MCKKLCYLSQVQFWRGVVTETFGLKVPIHVVWESKNKANYLGNIMPIGSYVQINIKAFTDQILTVARLIADTGGHNHCCM